MQNKALPKPRRVPAFKPVAESETDAGSAAQAGGASLRGESPLNGQQFGHYTLISQLGHGGYASIYLGVHHYLNTHVVLKRLNRFLASDEDEKRFQIEAPRKRPGGVTLVAVLVGIQGICRVLVAVFFLLGALLGGWALTTSSVVVGVIAGILAALVGLVTLYFAWGLWTLKRWAYWATVILMVLDLLGSVFEFTQPITGAWTIWGGVIIPDLFLLNVGNSLFLLERKQYIAQIDYVASNRVCASLFPASAKIVCSEDVRLSPNGYTANSDELLFHRWELYLSLYD